MCLEGSLRVQVRAPSDRRLKGSAVAVDSHGMQSTLRLAALSILGLAACAGREDADARSGFGPGLHGLDTADMAITQPPYAQVHANWKQRLDQAYVFVELTGSYTRIGESLAAADRAMRDQGIEASGPPFALFYDDPGSVATEALRARACFPVDARITPQPPLRYDELESTTVVYAYVAGPYPEVPRAYPGLLAYMRTLSWVEAGPIREVYLVDPAGVSDWRELVTEVQIPAASR